MTDHPHARPRRWRTLLRSALVLIGFLALSALLHLPHGLDHWSADLTAATLSRRLPGQHPDIALVTITNHTLADLPYLSPVDRHLLARLVRVVDAAGAKVIGLDFVLDRPTEPAKDAELRAALQSTRAPLVLGVIDAPYQDTFLRAQPGQRPPIPGYSYFGEHHSQLVIADHVVRLMSNEAAPESAPDAPPKLTDLTFAEAIADAAGRPYRPASPQIAWLLPPTNGAETFATIPAETLLGATPGPLATLLRDRLVLIGGDFDDRDQHLTPLSVGQDNFFPGLVIHAQILAQLLARISLYEPGPVGSVATGFVLALAAFWLGTRSGHRHLWLELGIVALLVLSTVVAFAVFGLLLPYNLYLLMTLTGAAVGHYAIVSKHQRSATH